MFETSKVKIDGNNQTVRTQLQSLDTPEHTEIVSRTLGKKVEIGVGPLPVGPSGIGGLVPANPFSSTSQQKFMYSNPSILGKKGLKEWSSKTDFKSLPKKVKKSK
jgi:hypothetical protein